MALKYTCTPTVSPSTITWEEIACPLCQANDEEPVLHASAEPQQTLYRLVRCRSCHMVYMNPRPNPDSIGQFYPDDYEAYREPRSVGSGWWSQCRRYLEQLVLSRQYGYPPALKSTWEKLLAVLAGPLFGPSSSPQTALPYQGEGRLLDYGCGAGHYAARMRQRGWTVTGMDFSAQAARRAEQIHHLEVVHGTLPHPAIRSESFDLITMGAVLEHVHWPHRLVAAAVEALRPGGLLAVSVPNFDSWGFRQFGEDWWPLELPRHLLHFTPVTLRRLMEAHGLHVEELRFQARGSWMRRSFERAGRPGQPFWKRLGGKLRLIPSLLTSWSVWTGQADSMLLLARRPAFALAA